MGITQSKTTTTATGKVWQRRQPDFLRSAGTPAGIGPSQPEN